MHKKQKSRKNFEREEMSNAPTVPQPVSQEEWDFVKQIQNCEHHFILLSRKATLQQTVPAKKYHPVEFFLKP